MAEHRTERRAYSRRYRQAHAAACRAADRAFHKRNRKKRNAASRVRSRIYYATHKDQYIENAAKRRAMLRGQFVESVNWRSIWERDKGTCQMCRKRIPFEKMGRDHIWPISKGGTHEPRNAQTLCRPCNSKKSNTGPGQPYLL
jgi:5-methylcytosine-specific restriction endonuclease McrA